MKKRVEWYIGLVFLILLSVTNNAATQSEYENCQCERSWELADHAQYIQGWMGSEWLAQYPTYICSNNNYKVIRYIEVLDSRIEYIGGHPNRPITLYLSEQNQNTYSCCNKDDIPLNLAPDEVIISSYGPFKYSGPSSCPLKNMDTSHIWSDQCHTQGGNIVTTRENCCYTDHCKIKCTDPDQNYTTPSDDNWTATGLMEDSCNLEDDNITQQCSDLNGTMFPLSKTNCCVRSECYTPVCTQPDTNYNPKDPADNQNIAFEWTDTQNRSAECSELHGIIQSKRVDCKPVYRCLTPTNSCPIPNQHVSSYISPHNDTFHEDIEITGAPFGLHYSSANLDDTNIAHGWSISNHARLVEDRIYYGSGAIYQVTSSTTEGNLTVVKLGSSELLFDSEGRLQSIRDLYTRETQTTFSYDLVGRLVTMSDFYGQIYTLERDSDGTVTAITDTMGHSTYLMVDNSGDLTEVQYEDTSSYTFTYERHLMTRETEPNGNAFEHFFDSSGKTIKVIDAEQGVWLFGSSTQSSYISHAITRAAGDTITYQSHFLSDGILRTQKTLPTGEIITYENAIDDSNATITSCGMRTTYLYRTNPDGTLYRDPYTGRRELAATIITTPSGLTKRTDYTKSYTENEGTLATIESSQTTHDNRFTQLRDIAHYLSHSSTPEDRNSTIQYDTHQRNITQMQPYGQLPTSYTYDAQGRMLTATTGTRTSSYSYDSRGNLASTTDPLGRVTTYAYDSRDRLETTTYPDGTTLHYSYDSNGNMTRLTTPTPTDHSFGYNGVNKVSQSTAPLGGTTSYTYDKQRRITQITKPSGATIDTTYTQGRVTQIETPEGSTTYSYACQSQPSTITRGSESIHYSYDGTLLTGITQSGILNQSITTTYNSDFLPDSMTYAGITTPYRYDRDGLLTGAGAYHITRSHDTTLHQSLTDGDYTQQTSFNGYGEVAEQNDNLYGYTLERNDNGQIIRKMETLAGVNSTSTYSYDDRGRLTEVNTTAQTPREDGNDQSDWHVYDQSPEGAQITTVYDELKESSVIAFEGDRTRNGYRLGYTGDSHPNSWHSTDTQITWSMRYDQSYVIYISTMTTKGHRYLYYTARNTDKGMHPNGLYIHHGLGSDSIDDTWHSITRDLAADLAEYEPDNELLSVNGFLIRGSGRIDDIATIDTDGVHTTRDNAQTPHETIITYEHNALNQRVAKLIDGVVVEKYLWADLTTLLAVYDGDDNLVQRFAYAGGRMPVSMTMGGEKYYLHYDQVGSLRAVSDTSHHIVKEITYDTYGKLLTDSNSSLRVPFGFAGGLYDSDTKLTRFGYRDYDAYTGKWTAKDPIGFDGGDSNLYGYVLGDPVGLVDFNGLSPDPEKVYHCSSSNYWTEHLHSFNCAGGICKGLYPDWTWKDWDKGRLGDDTKDFDNPNYQCDEEKPRGKTCNWNIYKQCMINYIKSNNNFGYDMSFRQCRSWAYLTEKWCREVSDCD